MKRAIFILLFFMATLGAMQAQKSNYIHISGDAGVVANSERDEKFGLGGTLSWLTQDVFIAKKPGNYISLGVKAFNNPYGEGKLISSIMNDKDDAFNYIMALAGYRITGQGISDGFFVEPRIGAVFGASGYTGFAFAPLAGYAYRDFDFAVYCDMGFGGENSAVLKKNFFTPGISIGYNFGF
jgi:hypothetical protein